MAGAPSRGVWKQLDGLFRFGTSGHLGDDELLGRFVSGRRDEAGEDAFAALVERHGPMVLGVCRRVLGDRHEAEDAFQATFLVLARKAGAIARRERLANWLHGVASRTALDARARADRRRARQRKASGMAAVQTGPDEGPERIELRAILDEELARLPDSYRGPVILCELDGLSRQAAARRLGIPEGTLSSRLSRAKGLLRHRLARRGLAPSAIALEAALAHEARALIVPPALAGSTIEAAARVAAGASLAGAASASVVILTQGALKAMLLAKIKGVALALATAAVVTTGVVVVAQPIGPAPGAQDDRLGALEKKLDRILEALGGRQGADAPNPPIVARFAGPAAEPKAAPSPSLDQPSSDAAPKSATTPGPNFAEQPPGMMGMMGGMRARMQGQMGPMMRGRMAQMGSNPAATPTIEDRVDGLEARLADLERRFNAMERRLSRAERPGGSSYGSSSNSKPEAAPKPAGDMTKDAAKPF
jgi:RNA polymerase sigma factor (sigma-70 family)